jgi:hypothetical protein
MANENNALTGLLRSGFSYGSQYASDKLFGSAPASNDALQVEKVQRGQLNGSGPVNARGSLLAPSTWTDFFFGARAGTGQDGAPGDAPSGPSAMSVVIMSVIAGLVVWWLVKRK